LVVQSAAFTAMSSASAAAFATSATAPCPAFAAFASFASAESAFAAIPAFAPAQSAALSAWRVFHVHQHLLQLLWLVQRLRQLLREHEQPHLRRRRPWVAVLVLRSRHRLQRLRREPPGVSASLASEASATASITAFAATAAIATSKAATTILVGESATVSTFASSAAFASTTTAAAAASVPLPTWRGCRVHQHVLRLLLLWVLRQVHVLRGPKY